MKLDFDVVIIGAGVAGMTAAIYLKRSGINCCLIEREVPGGQINKTSSVKNYPGYSDISGPDLSQNIFNQINDLGITYKYGNVLKIVDNNETKTIKTDIEDITTKRVIVATGRTAKKLGIKGEAELIGKGISYCALCDANFFKGEDVAVIGGANSAIEEALYLSDICKKVTIVYHGPELKCEKHLKESALEKSNIEIIYNYEVIEFNNKDDKLDTITIEKENKKEKIAVKGCFIYIGQTPSSKAFKDIIKFDKNGYIKVNKNLETNVPGIYAAGDIVKKETYQLITAMNDGVNVAMNCIKSLK